MAAASAAACCMVLDISPNSVVPSVGMASVGVGCSLDSNAAAPDKGCSADVADASDDAGMATKMTGTGVDTMTAGADDALVTAGAGDNAATAGASDSGNIEIGIGNFEDTAGETYTIFVGINSAMANLLLSPPTD